MLPILKVKYSTDPLVKDLQEALNRSRDLHHDSKLPPLKVDGIFGEKTEARVREYQGARGLSKDGQVGPLTRGFLFAEAYTLVTEAQQIALGWTLVARGAIARLRAEAARDPSGGPGPIDAIDRQALKTHFHLDVPAAGPAGPTVALLNQISATYTKIIEALKTASIRDEVLFRRVGRHEVEADFAKGTVGGQTPSTTQAATAFAYVLKDHEWVRFAPGYNDDEGLLIQHGPVRVKRVNTLIHECAHLVDPAIHDFAYETPAPDGRPGGAAGAARRNYAQLPPDLAAQNAPSYASFAQHIILRVDRRSEETFGLTRDTCEPDVFS